MNKVTSTDIKIALGEKHSKDFFLTECKSGSTWMSPVGDLKILDALAIRKSWTRPCFTGYEIKISRGDFLRDAKFYTYAELCNCLYIVCPKGMIDRTEVPESVGLMYYDPDKKTLRTRKKAIFREIEYSSNLLLYIIYSRLESDRYPFFDSRKEYYEAYVEGKVNSKELGRFIKTRLVQENVDLIREIENLRGFKKQYDNHIAIMEVLEKHHIFAWDKTELAQKLDQALSRRCPEDISSIRQGLEGLVNRVKRMEQSNEHTD